jgi:uncharacterized protein YtpQ (UPF0354 family)
VRLRALSCLVPLLLLAGCSGDEEPGPRVVSETAFKTAVAAAVVEQTGLEAEPGFGLQVRVSEEDGPDRVDIDLEEPYARYRRAPERRDAIVAELVREARERLERGLADLDFRDVRKGLMPVLKPLRELRGYAAEPAVREFPAGLRVIYAFEGEGEFLVVTTGDLERWGTAVAELDRQAVANLARQTRREEELLCEGDLCGWASGDGYDATRLIVPALRSEIVREIGPAVYAVPREDVFVALPRRLGERIRARVLRDFTTAPNPISPELFVEQDGALVVLEE